MNFDVIIIGAGAAGLAAMDELIEGGYNVCVLEAGEVAGGRIATRVPNDFGYSIETGAEFLHGKSPVTKALLRKANIEFTEVQGKMIFVRNGVWIEQEEAGGGLDEKKDELKEDCTIRQFLDAYFPVGEYDEVRKGVINFAEGFSLADIDKASFFAFLKEWEEQESTQHRIKGGYEKLIRSLIEWSTFRGGQIKYNEAVQRVEYKKGRVKVYTSHDSEYEASKLIVTVSAGVLQSNKINFAPPLGKHAVAIQQLGFGSVIKLIFLFREAFWFDRDKDIGFLLSEETIPTWWTQLPEQTPILTGWLGGPKATMMGSVPEDKICESGLGSLANIFGLDISFLRKHLISYRIMCWDNHSNVRGGYSYNTIDSAAAKAILQKPIDDIIYFAGEAVYSGDLGGTVEAALASGKMAAATIMGKHSYAEK